MKKTYPLIIFVLILSSPSFSLFAQDAHSWPTLIVSLSDTEVDREDSRKTIEHVQKMLQDDLNGALAPSALEGGMATAQSAVEISELTECKQNGMQWNSEPEFIAGLLAEINHEEKYPDAPAFAPSEPEQIYERLSASLEELFPGRGKEVLFYVDSDPQCAYYYSLYEKDKLFVANDSPACAFPETTSLSCLYPVTVGETNRARPERNALARIKMTKLLTLTFLVMKLEKDTSGDLTSDLFKRSLKSAESILKFLLSQSVAAWPENSDGDFCDQIRDITSDVSCW